MAAVTFEVVVRHLSGNATNQELGGIGATEPVDSHETAGPAMYSCAVTAQQCFEVQRGGTVE
jgi:hypothetical protein